jgi:tRNA U34 5-carboxymethylaminomethyl modifying enzyme MnmG/GidA
MTNEFPEALETLEKIEKKTKKFEEMLSELVSSDDKKKLLWKEIYENANLDRQNAYVLFVEAYTQMRAGIAEHAVIGSTLAKYLERMNKSNEQLLKLADLVAKAEIENSKIDSDDLFSKIKD